MTIEYGIFNDEGCVEGQFYSREEAEDAIRERYTEEDELHVDVVEPDDEDGEPEEGDLTTEDYVHFYYHGKLTLRVQDGEDWEDTIRGWMESEQYWPNVWWVSDHGNSVLLSF